MKKQIATAVFAALAFAGAPAMAYTAGDIVILVQDNTNVGTSTTFVEDLGTAATFAASLAGGTLNLGSAFTTWMGTATGGAAAGGTLQFMVFGGTASGGYMSYDNAASTALAAGGLTASEMVNVFATSSGSGTTAVVNNVLGLTTQAVAAANNPASLVNINAQGVYATGSLAPQFAYTAIGGTLNEEYFGGFGKNQTQQGTISLTTAGALSGTFAAVSAVPEPDSYALMVAGLLAVGAIVRRRSRA